MLQDFSKYFVLRPENMVSKIANFTVFSGVNFGSKNEEFPRKHSGRSKTLKTGVSPHHASELYMGT